MQLKVTIRDFANFPDTSALEEHIRKKAEKLTQFYDRITSCRVVVEMAQKHKRQGKLFNIRIDLCVPKKELVVTHKQNEDVYVAIRDAFNALNRQLEDYARKRHGHIKTHHHVMHGRVARLLSEEGYGFIEGMDGNEYYFSVTNVSYPQFTQLAVGDDVEYLPETVNEGWQAHHVVRARERSAVGESM